MEVQIHRVDHGLDSQLEVSVQMAGQMSWCCFHHSIAVLHRRIHIASSTFLVDIQSCLYKRLLESPQGPS